MAVRGDPLNELSHRMIHERDQLTDTLEALRVRAREELDPRRQLRVHFRAAVVACLGAGLVAGVLTGRLFSRR